MAETSQTGKPGKVGKTVVSKTVTFLTSKTVTFLTFSVK